MKTNFKQSIILISILIFLAIGAFFMVNVELPSWSYLLSAVNIFLFAMPTFWATKNWLGLKNAITLFVALGVFALLIETNAIVTGFPYGHFGYSELLGYKLFGYTPWTVAFAWTPLILCAFAVTQRYFENTVLRVLVVAMILLVFDLVLDPGAVLLGFWKYSESAIYYGVPFSNFVGWLFSGILGAILLEILLKFYFKTEATSPPQMIVSSFFILFFWTMISVFGAMIFPAIIGFVMVIGLAFFYQQNQ